MMQIVPTLVTFLALGDRPIDLVDLRAFKYYYILRTTPSIQFLDLI